MAAQPQHRTPTPPSSPSPLNVQRLLRTAITIAALTLLPAIAISALDLSLNGRQHIVVNSEMLAAHSRPDSALGGLQGLPLSALYPWLETVDYLEVQSGPNRVYWEASRLGEADWNGAKLVNYRGTWEVHVGRDIFADPDKIAVRGTRLDVPTLRIWIGADDGGFRTDLAAAMALRDVEVDWRETTQPAYLLGDPPAGALPHLILLDDLEVIETASLLTSFRPISGSSSQWLTTGLAAFEAGGFPAPLAVDAYDPEVVLHWVLAGNPDLFDAEGRLPAGLGDFLRAARDSNGELFNTEVPLNALYTGKAYSAIRTVGSKETGPAVAMGFVPFPAPEGTVGVLRLRYAGLPVGLSERDQRVADLVMADALRFRRNAGGDKARSLPIDPRTLRFVDAYDRIGRLAVSGQMEVDQAVDLINAYVNEE